jgi:hypothetical protein
MPQQKLPEGFIPDVPEGFVPDTPAQRQIPNVENPATGVTLSPEIQVPTTPPRTGVGGIIDKANTGLVPAPQIGTQDNMPQARESLRQTNPNLAAAGDKTIQFAQGVLNTAISPMSLASILLTGGGATVARMGLPAVGEASQVLGRGLGYPMMAEGAYNTFKPGATWDERAGGALELLGGRAMTKAPVYSPRIKYGASIEPPPTITPSPASIGKDKPYIPKLNNMTKLEDGMYQDGRGNIFDLNNKRVIVTNDSTANRKFLENKNYVPAGTVDEGPFAGHSFRVHQANIAEATPNPAPKQSTLGALWDLTRGMESIDFPYTTSAAFRQTLPLIGKRWGQAWFKAYQAFDSEANAKIVDAEIRELPLLKPEPKLTWNVDRQEWIRTWEKSKAEKMGLRMSQLDGPLSQRAADIQSGVAEKIPGIGRYVRASNRAFNAFTNYTNANVFSDLYGELEAQGITKKNPKVGQALAEYINTASGRGTLKLNGTPIDLEKGAQFWNKVLFSPRMMASRVNMLNPMTYIQAPEGVRKQYVYSMLNTMAAWGSFATFMKVMGLGDVTFDPTSADFGKVRLKNSNVRLDPGAGFLQWMVLAARLGPSVGSVISKYIPGVDIPRGGWTTTSGKNPKFATFGEDAGPATQNEWTIALRFAANKAHPNLKFVYDLMNATPKEAVPMWDRPLQMIAPMLAADVIQIGREQGLLPAVLLSPFAGLGGGVQSYEGEQNPNIFTPMLGSYVDKTLQPYFPDLKGKK